MVRYELGKNVARITSPYFNKLKFNQRENI